MTPEDRGNRPAPPSQPTQPAPGPFVTSGPVPLRPAASGKEGFWWWGGLVAGLVVLAVVAALVVVPLFSHGARTQADPFAISRNAQASGQVSIQPGGLPSGQPSQSGPVSGVVIATSRTAAPSTNAATSPGASATTPSRGTGLQVISKGDFTKIDAIHYARGTAVVGIGADGQKVLRFENFTSAPGPDLRVYLGTRPDGSLVEEGGLNLGPLPATDGSYNIALPDGLDPARYKSVVIWCEAFSTTFSVATLS